jgi:ribonuclease HII
MATRALDLVAAPFRVPRFTVRASAGLDSYESALVRAGFGLVAGADEAGRGACAGPLVVAACVLGRSRRHRIDGLADSKVLIARTRERLFEEITSRALAYSVVIVPAAEVDAFGLHVANLAGMRRALGTLRPRPSYALTDGFPVRGLEMPATAVWKGDAVIACIAAASILAKVTRDRIMGELHERWPSYDFGRHKGYVTAEHAAALDLHGPCPEHRMRYVNVQRAAEGHGLGQPASVQATARDNVGDSLLGQSEIVTMQHVAASLEAPWRTDLVSLENA